MPVVWTNGAKTVDRVCVMLLRQQPSRLPAQNLRITGITSC